MDTSQPAPGGTSEGAFVCTEALNGKSEDAPASHRAEAHFVTLCVRDPDAVPAGDLQNAAAAVQDWGAVVSIAARHRVAAHVRDAASREALALPERAASALQKTEFIRLATTMAIDAALRRLGDAFGAAGVPFIVLKGPALARSIYPRRGLRPYGDLDLTVQDRHQVAAVGTLLDQGFREVRYAAEDARRQHTEHLHGCAAFHRQFESADRQVLVELHTDPLQLGLQTSCEAARWQRAVPIPDFQNSLMLCPEDQIVHLSTHVHKHGFDRLIWLKDLDRLIRVKQTGINWDLVAHIARDEGVLGSVWYSLYLSQVLLSAPVPPAVLRSMRPALAVRLLYRQVWPVARIADLEGFMRRRAVQFHAAESWRGMLPSLILMGRRGQRIRASLEALLQPQTARRHRSPIEVLP